MTTPNPTPAGVAPITDWEIALVRERLPIADVVAEHIDLTDAGKGNLKGRCPFHKWNGSSSEDLYITPAHGFWYCYGCGDGGDVITFVRKLHGLGFHEALTLLAEQAGMRLGTVEVEAIHAELAETRRELKRAVRAAEADGPAAGMAVVTGYLTNANMLPETTTEEKQAMTANSNPNQLARETAEYIARELTPHIAHAGEGLTVVYADDRRPPTKVDEITANLLDGVLWVSWMDDRVLDAMRTLHGEPTGDAAIFA